MKPFNHIIIKPFLLLTVCALMLNFKAIAQEWAPVGAKWYFTAPTMSCNEPYFSFESVKDTFLLGKNARILAYSYLGSPASEMVITYGANDKVYYFDNGAFYLLYDFKAQAGDTLIIKIPEIATYFDISMGAPLDSNQYAKVKVDSTGIMNISGQDLKVQYTSGILDTSYTNYGWQFVYPIVEKIGCLSGLFGQSMLQMTVNCWGEFRCYSDSTLSYEPYQYQCDYKTYIEEGRKDEHIVKVYPTVVRTQLTIDITNKNIHSFFLSIYSFYGQRIYNNIELKNGINTIDITGLAGGIYFIQIKSDQNKLYNEKFIKL